MSRRIPRQVDKSKVEFLAFSKATAGVKPPRPSSQWNPKELPLRMHRSLASFAFPHSANSSNALAIENPSDVGTLSGRVTFKPVYKPFQLVIPFFRHPMPARSSGSLTGDLPCGTVQGFPRSTFMTGSGLGLSFTPVTRRPRYPNCERIFLLTHLLVGAYQPI